MPSYYNFSDIEYDYDFEPSSLDDVPETTCTNSIAMEYLTEAAIELTSMSYWVQQIPEIEIRKEVSNSCKEMAQHLKGVEASLNQKAK